MALIISIRPKCGDGLAPNRTAHFCRSAGTSSSAIRAISCANCSEPPFTLGEFPLRFVERFGSIGPSIPVFMCALFAPQIQSSIGNITMRNI